MLVLEAAAIVSLDISPNPIHNVPIIPPPRLVAPAYKWVEWSSCQRYLVFWEILSTALHNQMGRCMLVRDLTKDPYPGVPTLATLVHPKFEVFVAQAVSHVSNLSSQP